MPRWKPSQWAGLIPNGLGQVKPNHYGEILRTIYANRGQLPYAWRILRDGVCDGCALGTTGLRDFTLEGVHLCTIRLNLLHLNTMPALNEDLLKDVDGLRSLSGAELRKLGRLAHPMIRLPGDRGFRRISWEEALERLAKRIRSSLPDRLAFYLTSRGITNEVYYAAQKVVRFLGTNNIDNSARICHAPSTVALKASLGVSASTCSYRDWIGADLVVFVGSDVANNQPVTTKYLYYAKKKGTRIAVVNPYREPGLDRYWVPSVFESALFGTRLTDDFYPIHTGGDVAFFNGVLKQLILEDAIAEDFIRAHSTGFDELRDSLECQSWEDLETISGSTREQMRHFAQLYRKAKSAIFVWSMGVTQHSHGVANVHSIINLALARAMVGRPHCGLMPIRGHSGVQGGAEVGCVPNVLPGGHSVDSKNCQELSQFWGFPVPEEPGLNAVEMLQAAHGGDLDLLYAVGGNFIETLPDPDFIREALNRVPVRVHQDIVLSAQMLEDPLEEVVLLPGRTRYEQPGGGTETTTERYVIFSPEIPGRRIGDSRPEWQIFVDLAQAVDPERSHLVGFDSPSEIRKEMSKTVPIYAGIQNLEKKGDAFQWGGALLCQNYQFPTHDGKAHFAALELPVTGPPAGYFLLSTRRGKQFNSMVQSQHDPLTGARREDILMNLEDASELGLKEGDRVRLRSSSGTFLGKIRLAPIRPRNLQVHWPEGNTLIDRLQVEPKSGIPNYNALVEVITPSSEVS